MIALPVSTGKFLSGWFPGLAVAAIADPVALAPARELFVVSFHGLHVPVVTCILGAIGVLAARPLARKKESTLGIWGFLLVTLLMLFVVELWILESRPGWLFAFTIAIGLGFSGYSLIETIGGETQGFIKRIFSLATDTIGRLPGSKPGKDQ